MNIYYGIKYVVYNLCFRVLYILIWAKDLIFEHEYMYDRKFWARYLPPRDLQHIYKRKLALMIYKTIFGDNHLKRMRENMTFGKTFSRLRDLHRECILDSYDFGIVNEIGSIPNFHKDKLILIGFHQLGLFRGLLCSGNETEIDEIAILTPTQNAVEFLTTLSGLSYEKVNDEIISVNGIKGHICSLEDGIKASIRMMNLVNKKIPLLILVDDIFHKGASPYWNAREIFDEVGEVKDPSKFFIYRYNNRKLMIFSSLIVHLLQKTGAKGVPIYMQTLKDGRFNVVYDEPLTVSENDSIKDRLPEIGNRIGDFMIKNALENSWSWQGIGIIMKQLPFLWKTKKRSKQYLQTKAIEDIYNSEIKINFDFYLSKGTNNTYVLTNEYPFKCIKIDQEIRRILFSIKKYGLLSEKIKREISEKRVISVLANLYSEGIIDIKF